MKSQKKIAVNGTVHPDFKAVKAAFEENFIKRGELGGACCVYCNGEKVVDLWGGTRDAASCSPWQEDTMVVVFSLTKGMSAMTLALAHSRGWLDYDAHVVDYWPEFRQNDKQHITVRQLLAHQAGLHAFHEKVDRAVIAEPQRLAEILARETPQWPPGTRNAYHFLSLGFYEAELLRRIDPAHRSLGQFFHDEIAVPLGLEFYIGLPQSIPNERLAVLAMPGFVRSILGYPLPMVMSLLNPWSSTFRASMVNPGSGVMMDNMLVYVRQLEVPSGGGVGTARAIAKAYGSFATGGAALGLGAQTLADLRAPARAPALGFFDEVLRTDVKYALGFMKPFAKFSFGREDAFGAPGAGGSLGYADPAVGIGYGYVTNRFGLGMAPDPRDVALRQALASVVH